MDDRLSDTLVLLASLRYIERSGLSPGEAADVVRRLTEVEAWCQAAQLTVMAGMARQAGVTATGTELVSGRDLAVAELAPLLRITRRAAEQQVDLAMELTERLPATLEALHAGRISLAHAKGIAAELEVVDGLADAERAQVEDLAVARAVDRTPAQTRNDVRRAVLAVDPEAAAKRHEAKRRLRCVQVRPLPDGMGELAAQLPVDDLAVVDTVLDALADKSRDARVPGDDRSHDQRRADALVGVFASIAGGESIPAVTGAVTDGVWAPPALPTRHGRFTHLVVHVTDATLTGGDDQPGVLAGYGPVPAHLARKLAASAARVSVARSPGHTADEHRGEAEQQSPYRPSAEVVESVLAQNTRCRHPGCRRIATQCDLDHLVPYGQGGVTCECNLVPLCRFHHRLKTHGGWTARQIGPDEAHAPGTIDWTSPSGYHYTDPPDDW